MEIDERTIVVVRSGAELLADKFFVLVRSHISPELSLEMQRGTNASICTLILDGTVKQEFSVYELPRVGNLERFAVYSARNLLILWARTKYWRENS
jgi:hypothetical protein